ncbi:GGDEF domain-containing protein [Ruminococcaceae bacterium OttesenSCG-928-O06]|nr:GGDEF domain-containing protein [Ruminococcaceae bacterium OttesenSCG-928-O06]
MLQRARNQIIQRLMRRSYANDDEVYLFMLCLVATTFCLAIHLYLSVVFLAFGMWPYVGVNLFSIAVYLFMYPLIKRGRYTPVGLGISLEVMAYATLFGFLHGIGTYVIGYYLLVLVMQIIIPYGSVRLRLWVGLAAVACTTASLLAHFYSPHVSPMPAGIGNILMVSNIYLLIIGTVVELLIDNVLQHLIAGLNEKRMAELSTKAYTDALTGLYNRRYAEIYFEELAARQKQTCCVAMLDIDDFKLVNDSCGHACGDEVLVFLAGFLREHLRKSDKVFRWGGEEFLLVLENISLEDAAAVLDKLREALAHTPIHTQKGEVVITVTIGLAPLQVATHTNSIECCDANLYTGKRTGKNVVVAG